MNYYCSNSNCIGSQNPINEIIANALNHLCPICHSGNLIGNNFDIEENNYIVQVSDNIDNIVLNEFPFIIAYPYFLALNENDPYSKRNTHLIFTFLQLMKFSSLIFLSQYFNEEVIDKSVSIAIRNLRLPHFNDWITLLNTLCKNIYKLNHLKNGEISFSNDVFLPELRIAIYELSKMSITVPVHDVTQVCNYSGSPFDVFRNFRNLEKGHSGVIDENRDKQTFPIYLEHIRKILSCFKVFSKIDVIRYFKQGDCFISLKGYKGFFEPIHIDSLNLLTNFNHIFIKRYDEKKLNLYPLFLSYDEPQKLKDGLTDPLLLFDGYNNKRVVFLGVKTHTERQDLIEEYLYLLDQKGINILLKKEEIKPWLLCDWIRETTERKLKNLLNKKYFPEYYIDRELIDSNLKQFIEISNLPMLIIAGDAGLGKTSLICNYINYLFQDSLLSKRKENGFDGVLLITGNELKNKKGVFDKIKFGAGISDDITSIDEILDVWVRSISSEEDKLENRKFYIFVDAINESEDPRDILGELDEISLIADDFNKKIGYCCFKLIASIRSENLNAMIKKYEEKTNTKFFSNLHLFQHFKHHQTNELIPYLELRSFTIKELKKAYNKQKNWGCKIEFDDLNDTIRKFISNPLILSIFHKVYNNITQVEIKNIRELWNSYLKFIYDQISSNVEKHIENLLEIMILTNKGYISLDEAIDVKNNWKLKLTPVEIITYLDPIETLLEIGILQEEDINSTYSFIQQMITEELLYRYIVSKTPNITKYQLVELLKPVNEHVRFSEYYKAIELILVRLLNENDFDTIIGSLNLDPNFINLVSNVAVFVYVNKLPYFDELVESLSKDQSSNSIQTVLDIVFVLRLMGNAKDCIRLIEKIQNYYPEKSKYGFILKEILIDMTHLQGDYKRAVELLEKFIPVVEEIYGAQSSIYYKYIIRLAHHQMFYCSIDISWGKMIDLEKNINKEENPKTYIEVLCMLGGNLATLKGDFETGIIYLKSALDLASKINDDYSMSRCERKLSDYFRFFNKIDQAELYCKSGVNHSNIHGGTRQRLYLYCTQAELYRINKDYFNALKYYKVCELESVDKNIQGWIAHSYLGQGETKRLSGDLESSNICLIESLNIYKSINQNWGIIHSYISQFLLSLQLNRPNIELIKLANKIAVDYGYQKDISYTQYLLTNFDCINLQSKEYFHHLMFL